MCRRSESIQAVNAAAQHLTAVCEARLHAPPAFERIDPAHPTHAGTSKAIRTAFQDLSTTPADMALQLKEIGRAK
jgi:hypothetical protein